MSTGPCVSKVCDSLTISLNLIFNSFIFRNVHRIVKFKFSVNFVFTVLSGEFNSRTLKEFSEEGEPGEMYKVEAVLAELLSLSSNKCNLCKDGQSVIYCHTDDTTHALYFMVAEIIICEI